MTLTIQFTPQEEAWLAEQAAREGVQPDEVVKRLVGERLHEAPSREAAPTLDARQKAAIAMLQSWLQEDATDDPAEIRRAEEELEELKRNLNANRAATGERLLFP